MSVYHTIACPVFSTEIMFYFQYPSFSSITHKNDTDKPSLTFLWNPPTANVSHNVNVTFYATLARNHEEFWVMQPSNAINISVSGGVQVKMISSLVTVIQYTSHPDI